MMKSRYSPEFQATLACVGLTPQEWRVLVRRRFVVRGRRTSGVQKIIRRVQRIHTGKAMWINGWLVRRINEP